MHRLLFIAAAFAAFLSLAPAVPVPKHLMPEPVLYYPTKVGTKWVYKSFFGELTEVVTETELRKDGSRLVTIESSYEADDFKVTQTVAVSEAGLFRVQLHGRKYDPPHCLFRTSATTRGPWENMGRKAPIDRRMVLEAEDVRVPSGTYLAVPVEVTSSFGGEGLEGINVTTTEWYVKGVGLVKSEALTDSRTLLSFTPGKD